MVPLSQLPFPVVEGFQRAGWKPVYRKLVTPFFSCSDSPYLTSETLSARKSPPPEGLVLAGEPIVECNTRVPRLAVNPCFAGDCRPAIGAFAGSVLSFKTSRHVIASEIDKTTPTRSVLSPASETCLETKPRPQPHVPLVWRAGDPSSRSWHRSLEVITCFSRQAQWRAEAPR